VPQGFGVSGSRLQRRVRVLVFDKLMRYSIPFFDFHSVGELTTMLDEDSDAVGNVTGLQQGQRVQVFTCLLAGMVVALAYAWQIGLIAIACVPLMLGASLLQAKYASRDPSGQSLISPETLLERSLANIVVLQAFGLRDDTSRKYDLALEPDANFKKKSATYTGLAYGLSQFAVFGTFALVFYAGVKLMLSVKLQFTDFFVALLSVMFSSFGAGQCGADFSARKRGLEAAARLFEVADGSMDDGNDPSSDAGNKPDSLKGKVSFKNCHFAYPTRKNNMIYYSNGDRDGFSLDIDSRQSVAFTGRSGCGKSTALQILLRFYNVDQGTVKLDGHDISDLNIGWLRDQIGYVGQMPTLFAGSIIDNIKLGKPDATNEEIVEAAKAANANDFILELSEGYNTDIGVGGSLLSGGQRQRVAIARAIVKDPKLLVLDEATAALDNESEKIVQAALDRMQEANARTTLVVAHRLETVKKCDKIVVLDGGGVKEEGTHDELLKMEGIYHSLWTKQGH
jgi:ATP-binding cassette subfamily B (MDR/TAP) protein 1